MRPYPARLLTILAGAQEGPRVEIAPGIRRIGAGLVNAYLLEEAGLVTIVDAGAPAYWRDLPSELVAMGRSLDDVRAVVLTHGHSDHIGFAERIRQERGTPVHVHELDAALARGEAKNPARGLGPYRIAPLLRFVAFGVTHGFMRIPSVQVVATFRSGATLDLPGAPRVIHVPGHTPGSAALHVVARDAIFVGDALATYAVTTGAVGPQLAPFTADREQALASLSRLDGLAATYVLPGHGQVWTRGVDEAVRLVRESAAAGALAARGRAFAGTPR
jgi:glyoxylase-like metal-dependent hydrolase (beta-lactamase superfamily II)